MLPHPTIGTLLKGLVDALARMSTYESGHAGPALRSAIRALEDFLEYPHGTRSGADPVDLTAATACCEAAEEIRARGIAWSRLVDHPFPSCDTHTRALYRTAEALSAGILSDCQRRLAGLP